MNAALSMCNCFRSELLSTRLGCEYERFRNTSLSTKESWDVSGVYFIFIFFFILFLFFLLECLWSAKMLGIEGQLISVYQAASFWTVYFSSETCAGSDHDLFTT